MSGISYLRTRVVCAAAVAAASLMMAAPSAHATVTPVLEYNFPASWNGTGTGQVINDLSPAGNKALVSTTAGRQPTLSTNLPPGAPAGTNSLVTTVGGAQTVNKSLLTNPLIAAAGGFSYTVDFRWDGTDNSNHVEKIIDYAGTESLQLDTINTAAGTANLDFIFTTQGVSPAPDTTAGPLLPILANTWYQATATFDTLGNPLDGSGNVTGLATLTVGPVGGPMVSASLPVTKTTYGDGAVLGPRPIGIGELGFPSTTSALVLFHGNLYDPAVSLGVVPEPATLSLLGLGALGLVGRRRRA